MAPPVEEDNIYGDEVDAATFDQILEMDDGPEDREFSQSIVFDFFGQADTTFTRMEDALKDKDLPQLSDLGHFLKGSSATLGFTNVKNACEKIQNLGKLKDETGEKDATGNNRQEVEDTALASINKYTKDAKLHTKLAEVQMLAYYGLDERP